MQRLARALMVVLLVVSPSARAQELTAVDGQPTVYAGDQTFLLGRNGQVLKDGAVTPEGLALCAEMKMAPDRPCRWDTILGAAQQQTDPALWISNMSTGPSPAEFCWRPVALETFSDGDGVTTALGCHVRDVASTITPDVLDRLEGAARRLQQANPKTLAQQQAISSLNAYTEELEKSVR